MPEIRVKDTGGDRQGHRRGSFDDHLVHLDIDIYRYKYIYIYLCMPIYIYIDIYLSIYRTLSRSALQAFSSTARLILTGLVTVRSSPTTYTGGGG